MFRTRRQSHRPLAHARALCALLASTMLVPAAAGAAGTPSLDHIIVVVMENHSYDQVRTSPYIASLITAGAVFTNSYAVTHPSQPNYLALWAGGTQGVTNDVCPAPGSPYTSENLGHASETAGLTWRAYSENLPAAGSAVCLSSGTLYARKHEPWTNWSNLNHTNERPYSDLAADISNGTLPALAFVVPNQCNDMHDCSVATGDAWLAANVPTMLAAVGPRGMVVLTWDEDNNAAGNHILTVFVGPSVLSNFVSAQTITHYTLLRCLCETLGLTPFGNAVTAASITDVWAATVPAASSSWGEVKALYR